MLRREAWILEKLASGMSNSLFRCSCNGSTPLVATLSNF
jgi:hypothetical protein